MYLTYYWLFSWVCSFSIKHALNEYLKQNNNEKAKTTITTKKIGQEHDFKNWDAYCIAQNAERKTRCFVCERKTCNTQRLPVEAVVSKSPTHRLETSSLNLNLSKPGQEKNSTIH